MRLRKPVPREQALHRDNYACQKCGSTKDIEAHHIIPRRYKECTDDLENYKTLCVNCHRSIEPAHKMGPITNPNYRPVKHGLSSVAVTNESRLRLDKLGSRHETYDSIINRLIDEHEHKARK
jgi:hypothetical protein